MVLFWFCLFVFCFVVCFLFVCLVQFDFVFWFFFFLLVGLVCFFFLLCSLPPAEQSIFSYPLLQFEHSISPDLLVISDTSVTVLLQHFLKEEIMVFLS